MYLLPYNDEITLLNRIKTKEYLRSKSPKKGKN